MYRALRFRRTYSGGHNDPKADITARMRVMISINETLKSYDIPLDHYDWGEFCYSFTLEEFRQTAILWAAAASFTLIQVRRYVSSKKLIYNEVNFEADLIMFHTLYMELIPNVILDAEDRLQVSLPEDLFQDLYPEIQPDPKGPAFVTGCAPRRTISSLLNGAYWLQTNCGQYTMLKEALSVILPQAERHVESIRDSTSADLLNMDVASKFKLELTLESLVKHREICNPFPPGSGSATQLAMILSRYWETLGKFPMYVTLTANDGWMLKEAFKILDIPESYNVITKLVVLIDEDELHNPDEGKPSSLDRLLFRLSITSEIPYSGLMTVIGFEPVTYDLEIEIQGFHSDDSPSEISSQDDYYNGEHRYNYLRDIVAEEHLTGIG